MRQSVYILFALINYVFLVSSTFAQVDSTHSWTKLEEVAVVNQDILVDIFSSFRFFSLEDEIYFTPRQIAKKSIVEITKCKTSEQEIIEVSNKKSKLSNVNSFCISENYLVILDYDKVCIFKKKQGLFKYFQTLTNIKYESGVIVGDTLFLSRCYNYYKSKDRIKVGLIDLKTGETIVSKGLSEEGVYFTHILPAHFVTITKNFIIKTDIINYKIEVLDHMLDSKSDSGRTFDNWAAFPEVLDKKLSDTLSPMFAKDILGVLNKYKDKIDRIQGCYPITGDAFLVSYYRINKELNSLSYFVDFWEVLGNGHLSLLKSDIRDIHSFDGVDKIDSYFPSAIAFNNHLFSNSYLYCFRPVSQQTYLGSNFLDVINNEQDYFKNNNAKLGIFRYKIVAD